MNRESRRLGVARKLLVVGAGESGKSTLIAALCGRSLNLEVGGRTVAMDHGMLSRGDRVLSVVGVPGQVRFAAVREALVSGAAGAVWVVRASAESDVETARLLATLSISYWVYRNRWSGESRMLTPWSKPEMLGDPVAVIDGDLRCPETNALPELEAAIWQVFED